MNGLLGKTRLFILDTMAELRKCSWPERNELMESTLLVIIAVFIISVFIFTFDQIFLYLIKLITP